MITVSGEALASALSRAPADKRAELDQILDGERAMSLALLVRVGGFHALCGVTEATKSDPSLGRILAEALEPVTDRIVSQAKHGHPGPGRSGTGSLRDCPINLMAPTMAQAHDRALRSGACASFEALAWSVARESDKELLASRIAATLAERQAA